MPLVPALNDLPQARGGSNASLLTAPTSQDISSRQIQQAGAGLQRVGAYMGAAANKALEHANQVRVNESVNDLVRAKLQLTYDPEQGFARLKGRDAIERPDGQSLEAEYLSQLKERSDEIAGSLGNDRQREMFAAASGRMLTEFETSLAQHRAGQYRDYQLSVQQGTVDTAMHQMALAWGDQKQVDEARGAIKAAVVEAGRLQGKSAQEVQGDIVEALSPGHAAVVSSALDSGRGDYARQYFEDHKSEMTPVVQDRLRDQLKVGDLKDKSTRIALRLSGDLASQRQKLDSMFEKGEISAEVRDATLARVTAKWSQDRAIENEQQKRVIGAAQDWALNNPGATIHDLPANLYGALKAHGQLATISNFMNNGGKNVNDAATWASVVGMTTEDLAAMTPTEFYNQYRGKLDDSHLEKGYALIAAARNEPLQDPKASGLLTALERTKRAVEELDLNEEQAVRLENEIDKRVLMFERTELGGKRTASESEIKQIADEAVLDRVWIDKAFWRDPEQPLALIEDDDLEDAYVKVGKREVRLSEIPVDWQVEITRRLVERRELVTQQKIAEIWLEAGAQK